MEYRCWDGKAAEVKETFTSISVKQTKKYTYGSRKREAHFHRMGLPLHERSHHSFAISITKTIKDSQKTVAVISACMLETTLSPDVP